MTRKQRRSFLIGTLLGDTSFHGKKNKGLLFGHCEHQRGYGEWKLNLISTWFSVSTKSCLAKGMTSPSKKRTNFYRFWTTSDHRFTALYKRMVINGKKTITPKLLKNFNEISLAVLFMDNGCKETCKGKIKTFKISMGSSSLEEMKLLADHIKSKFNLDSKVYLEHRKYPCIKFTRKENKEKFVNLIKPYMHIDMLYKIQ